MAHHLWLGVALVFAVIEGARCLCNVSLEVVPEAVQYNREAILRCHYDLEGAPLYSVKWYRGRHEFYRFLPSESPATKTFKIPAIDVDLTNSNESQVMLRKVDFSLSGNFSCEVTADAPSFSTAFVSKKLTVVSLPEGKPTILSERERYEAGDILKANCSSRPSKPSTQLSFTLNNIPVRQAILKHRPEYKEGHINTELQRSDLSLSLQLNPSHFVNGQLNLHCTAEIPGIYSSMSEKQLGPGSREPIPERVTSENGCRMKMIASLPVLCLIALHPFLR